MAEGERTFLGLTHNPFLEPSRGFFERGGRKTHLEQLRHLSQWSRRILLVTGLEGVGKTTLYRELAATLEPRVKAARINGSLINTGREVLSAIAQGFGLAVPVDANIQALRFAILEHVEVQVLLDRLCLALIDDAHLLDNKAVDELITLTHESSLHLVLFGEVRVVPVIERAASSKGVGWQEIRLTGYGEADTREYLEWRFQQAKYRGRVPFTDHEVRDLARMSGGLPGRINQMANVLLVKLESGESGVPRNGFPKMHAALLALLVTVVGLFYVLVTDDESSSTSEPVVDLATASDQEALPAEQLSQDALVRVGSPLAETEEASAVENESIFREALMAEKSADTEAVAVVADPPVAADLPAADLPAAVEAAVEPVSTGAEKPVAESVTVPVTAPVMAPVMAPKGGTDSAVSPAEPSEPAEEIQPAVAPTESPVVAASSPPARVEPKPQPVPAGAHDTNWLLKQNPAYFTLQLVTVSTLERASAFVERQQDAAEFTIYQLERDGRVLHVVLYGLFSSREAAQRAADQLPAETGDVQPWIRQIEQVQAVARISVFQ